MKTGDPMVDEMLERHRRRARTVEELLQREWVFKMGRGEANRGVISTPERQWIVGLQFNGEFMEQEQKQLGEMIARLPELVKF